MTKQELLKQLKARLDESEKLHLQLCDLAKELNAALERVPKSEWDTKPFEAVHLYRARLYAENAEEKQDKTSEALYEAIESLKETPERLLEQSARSETT